MPNLLNATVAVTGATGSIGLALCRALAKQGCRIGLLGRSAGKLDEVADELRGVGATVAFSTADLRVRTDVHDAMAALADRLGSIDVLVHNAGIGRVTTASAPELDDIEEMLGVNYLGGVYATEAVLPSMLARRRGQLVAVSSLAALRGMAFTAGYSASKAAFATYLEALRPALRLRGVAASTCYLGFVRTPMSDALPLHPALWRIRSETAARRIVRAIRRGSRESYFPWYDALGARLLRRLPARVFDSIMARFGRLVLRGEY